MIKHIVMWTLKDEYKGSTKVELAKELKTQLLNLKGKIAELKFIEVGVNDLFPDKNHDVVLVTEFDSVNDLQTYAQHPEHLKVVEFVKEIATGRAAVDYTF